ncbi:LuxR C-terminal-related transcriptional regulator [Streptacidiphilus sp. N1-10]|uniref:LuxR C-terminal-related transcriptional regulator n=1 Tax=Streptacidiphilus jeojiensis TaxID=3229225 RepID=A0ABV6XZV5_9ACTN
MRTGEAGGVDMTFSVHGRRVGELPAEVTGFVGRSAELATVERLLTQARLVTLTGPGGVGKTRIALRTVAGMRERYPDGVFLVELSALPEPELLPRAVCAALGIVDQTARPPLDFLTEYLADRTALLVLDTCEHLVDACAMLADLLLRDAPGIGILATSRQPLDVPGEHTLVIPPLPVQDEGPDGVGAVALFAQRASAVLPGFALGDGNRADVLALCRRLDGIPLAIELATVRLRALPLDQLVARLEDRFRLLTGGRRTALPRHQTLRTTIGWSHELCTAEERLLWARLSVFAGSFDLTAVERVCAGGELAAGTVLEQLIGLVDKSVVLRVDSEDARTRYRLLDTIREYGGEWLEQTGEEAAVRHRHLAHYRAMAGEFRTRFATDAQLPLFRALGPELENLRAALRFQIDSSTDPDQALSFCTDLWAFWVCSGLHAEGRHWIDLALAEQPAPTAARSLALSLGAQLSLFAGDHDGALPGLLEALAIAEQLDDDRLRLHAHHFLTLAAGWRGDYEQVEAHTQKIFEYLRPGEDPVSDGLMMAHWALKHVTTDRPDKGVEICDAHLAVLAAEPDECWLRGFLLLVKAQAQFALGQYQEASLTARQSLRLRTELGDRTGQAYALEVLAWVAAAEGRHRRAAWLLGAAAALWERSGLPLSGAVELHGPHDTAVRLIVAALGEPLRAECHRQGASCEPERAVELALSEADTPQPVQNGPEQPARAPGPDLLTRREREVAALVAQGMSNRQVAERLVISKRTADAHVEHILAKLGFSSRTEIAAAVARSQVVEGSV